MMTPLKCNFKFLASSFAEMLSLELLGSMLTHCSVPGRQPWEGLRLLLQQESGVSAVLSPTLLAGLGC